MIYGAVIPEDLRSSSDPIIYGAIAPDDLRLTLRFTEPIFWRHLRGDVSPFTECGYVDDLRREVRANCGAEVFDAIYGG